MTGSVLRSLFGASSRLAAALWVLFWVALNALGQAVGVSYKVMIASVGIPLTSARNGSFPPKLAATIFDPLRTLGRWSYRTRMKQHAYEWDPQPPTDRQCIVAGIFLVAFVPAMLNYHAGWALFRGYDNWVIGGLGLVGLFLWARLPSVRRVEGVPHPLGYWLYLGLGLLAAAALWALKSDR